MTAVTHGAPAPLVSGGRDPCVVETAPVKDIVLEFVDEWRQTRPSKRGQRGYDENCIEPLGAYASLSFDTGLPETVLRKIRHANRYPLMELRIADALVNVIGEPCMFHDGTLVVFPNPLVRDPRLYEECCGGNTQTLARIRSTSVISVTVI